MAYNKTTEQKYYEIHKNYETNPTEENKKALEKISLEVLEMFMDENEEILKNLKTI